MGWNEQAKSKVFYWQRSKELANRRLATVHILTRGLLGDATNQIRSNYRFILGDIFPLCTCQKGANYPTKHKIRSYKRMCLKIH
jgi:hypothetical protein